MEIEQIPLTYRLKLWYWYKQYEDTGPPFWWKVFLNNNSLKPAIEVRNILKEYAYIEDGIGISHSIMDVTFYSHEHLTQFILKFC